MRISASFDFLLSLVLIFYSNSFEYAVIFLLSAFIHEVGHMTLLVHLKVKKPELHLGLLGADISADMSRLGYRAEMAVYLGGAFFNLIFVLLSVLLIRYSFNEIYVFFCFSNLFYALFNLLPIRMLDGGRALECFFMTVSDNPWRAEKISWYISCVFSFALCVLSVWLTFSFGINITLILVILWALYQCIPSKPCCLKTS